MSKLNTPEELVLIIVDECDESVPDMALIGGAAQELERRIAELEAEVERLRAALIESAAGHHLVTAGLHDRYLFKDCTDRHCRRARAALGEDECEHGHGRACSKCTVARTPVVHDLGDGFREAIGEDE